MNISNISLLSLKVYAICVVLLFFKGVSTGIYQGIVRSKAKAYSNPEDAKALGGKFIEQELPEIEKANKAFRNDFENIPVFLALSLTYVLLGCWELGALIYFPIFTFARYLHTYCYIKSIQPYRSMSYGIGLSISFIVAIHILYKVIFV